MNKNILFVFRSMGTGGAQKIQGFVANACVKAGYDVSIISLSKTEPTIEIDSRIKIHTLDYDVISNSRENLLKYIWDRVGFQYKLRKKIQQLNPALVCVFLTDIVMMTVLALKGTKYPIIGSERGDPNQFSEKKVRQYTKAYNECDAVVFQLKELTDFYKLNDDIIIRDIPNPSILRNKIPQKITFEEPYIFSGGRLHKQKRFDILIKAYEIVQKKYPEYKLRIYGEGDEFNNLEELVTNMGLTKKVLFMGDKKNIFEHTNKDSIFILSSDYEGIPNVISEALLYGVPCISTDTSPGGARLLLNNGGNGDIVAPGDYEGLAKTIIKYIENPNYVAEKVSNGKKYIRKFNPSLIEREWLNLFKEVLDNERAR